jgi:hypothetical protein
MLQILWRTKHQQLASDGDTTACTPWLDVLQAEIVTGEVLAAAAYLT